MKRKLKHVRKLILILKYPFQISFEENKYPKTDQEKKLSVPKIVRHWLNHKSVKCSAACRHTTLPELSCTLHGNSLNTCLPNMKKT
jgi:hypothetical protein